MQMCAVQCRPEGLVPCQVPGSQSSSQAELPGAPAQGAKVQGPNPAAELAGLLGATQSASNVPVGATNGLQGPQVPSFAGSMPLPPQAQTPHPWLRGSAESDLLSGLVTGTKQLQDALIKKESDKVNVGRDEPDTAQAQVPGIDQVCELYGVVDFAQGVNKGLEISAASDPLQSWSNGPAAKPQCTTLRNSLTSREQWSSRRQCL